MRTLCTLIHDPEADRWLTRYAAVLEQPRHWAFKEIYILKTPVNDVKCAAQDKFDITARQFNGINAQLRQAVESWREGLKFRLGELTECITGLKGVISSLEKKIVKERKAKEPNQRRIDQWWFTIHQKKRHLASCQGKREELVQELAGPPRICFGGRELLRQGKIEEWQTKRRSQIFLVGSSDETCGNQSCQWDGESLLIKLPERLGGERVRLKGVRFGYGQDCLAKRAGQPLTWLLFRDEEGRWHAHLTLPETPAEVTHQLRWGGIGVDVNENHFAVSMVDRNGNLIGTETLDFPESGLTTGVAEDILWSSVHRLILLAQEHHCGIVVEDLDFAKKKSYLKKFSKQHAKRLSSFAYAKFFEFLAGACARAGVELVKVNPAYTSQIGRLKYALGYRITVHHASALVIARRGINLRERLSSMDGGTLLPAASTGGRHVSSWQIWAKVTRLTKGEVGRLVSMLVAIGFWAQGIVPGKRLSRVRKRSPKAVKVDFAMSWAPAAA